MEIDPTIWTRCLTNNNAVPDGDVNVLDDILSLESAYLDPEPEEKKDHPSKVLLSACLRNSWSLSHADNAVSDITLS